ncbi:DUF4214 domain-containing protein [Motiliproteus sp. MSK22-1]|uniref:DUF4214 domain-containing protein n=1 Tax=Motiliproteus sp. MSK22-1 TaxID=1897630 RepID=UPI000975F43C|nr:DUF4214 domain-containing protein [Motiliproteus sp. MSK22-1]OMH30531.1 hypothetical protein BGP75_17480 [Motiliproteus sp. MSK22-1]
MATIGTAYHAVDMIYSNVFYGDVIEASSNTIRISDGRYEQVYQGQFTYDSYGLSGGVVNATSFYEYGELFYKTSGGPYQALSVERYINNNDLEGLYDKVIFSGEDTINGSNENDTLSGFQGNDIIYGNSGDDIIIDTSGDDRVYGGNGNDLISIDYYGAYGGHDVIDGGEGIDTLVYTKSLANYSITTTGSNGSVTDNSGQAGYAEIVSVERLRFIDKSLALDTEGNAGQAYRIYKAAFDRTPDSGGLGYWIDVMDNGHTLEQVAAGFINSIEFQDMYGENPSDEQFLTALYNNVLDRGPDDGGYLWWLDSLGSGAFTREGALAGFSESAENQENVIELIANGIMYDEWAG